MRVIPTIDRRTAAFGLAASLVCMLRPSGVSAKDAASKSPTPLRVGMDLPQTQRWRIGLKLTTPVTITDVIATFPIPVDWPEQQVRLVSKDVDRQVHRWVTRVAPGGSTQVVMTIPKVAAGSDVTCLFDFDVTKSRITPPDRTDDLVIPARVPRDLQRHLGSSPQIDSSHRRIREAYAEILAESPGYDAADVASRATVPNGETAWELVQRIYDDVRRRVRYVDGPLRNASEALKLGEGDCEEMTSLFVALCRNAKIPARMVWVPEHCYPEFYLHDADGNGHWFPAQAAGTRQFGCMEEYRPILQRGDNFRVPEKNNQPQRYLTEFFSCQVKGKGEPRPEFYLELIQSD